MPGANDQKTQAELDAEAAAKAKTTTQNQNPGGDGGGNPDDDENMSPEDMKKVIKSLRAENAKARTKGKSQEDSTKSLLEQINSIKTHLGIKDEADPAEQVKSLKSTNENLELELSLTQLARAHSIPVEQDDYFRFLMSKEISKLEKSGEDGQELSEDAINSVVEEVKKVSSFKAAKPNNNSTGVGDGDGGKPNGGSNDALTVEQFAKMSMAEKSKLFTDNKAEYDRLFKLAKEKRLY